LNGGKKNTKEKETDEANCNFNKLLDKWEDKKINLTISTNKKYTFLKLKESISLEIGIEPRRFRIFKKEHNTNLKLLKDNTKILEELLKKSKFSKADDIICELGIEILDQPEDLKKVI
jgi:hypothetical protein